MSVVILVDKAFLQYALEPDVCYNHAEFKAALVSAGWRTNNPNEAEAVRLITKRRLERGSLRLCDHPQHATMKRVMLTDD